AEPARCRARAGRGSRSGGGASAGRGRGAARRRSGRRSRSSARQKSTGKLNRMAEGVGPNYKWVVLSNTTMAMLLSTIDASIMLIAMPDVFRGIHLDTLA